jgi:hypothetical protein
MCVQHVRGCTANGLAIYHLLQMHEGARAMSKLFWAAARLPLVHFLRNGHRCVGLCNTCAWVFDVRAACQGVHGEWASILAPALTRGSRQ